MTDLREKAEKTIEEAMEHMDPICRAYLRGWADGAAEQKEAMIQPDPEAGSVKAEV